MLLARGFAPISVMTSWTAKQLTPGFQDVCVLSARYGGGKKPCNENQQIYDLVFLKKQSYIAVLFLKEACGGDIFQCAILMFILFFF